MLLNFIDYWKSKTFLQIFTIYIRYLIGGAFIMAAFGMGKIDGTSNLIGSMDKPIQDLMPLQQFFRVMTDSGLYWKFFGWAQIVAGMLLMTQWLAKVGALIFFSIILNIFVVTLSYDFAGTLLVTALMLLATVYLIIWDMRTFLILVNDNLVFSKPILSVHDSPFWVLLGVVLLVSVLVCASLKIHLLIQITLCIGEGFAGLLYFFIVHQRKITPQL